MDIAVTFRPDHPSELFADVARIELFGKQEGYVLQLKGAAKTKIMYLRGGDEITPRVESLNITPEIEEFGKSKSGRGWPRNINKTIRVGEGTEEGKGS